MGHFVHSLDMCFWGLGAYVGGCPRGVYLQLGPLVWGYELYG